MMIGFQGHMKIMFFIFFFLGASSVMAARYDHTFEENPLVDLSTTDDLIKLAGYGDEKLSTVVVGGTLNCGSNPIHGASVSVSCHDTSRKSRKSNWVRGETEEYGEFLIDLPSHLHAIPEMEKRCFLRILHLPKMSPCHQHFKGKNIGIKLSSSKNGVRKYSTGEIHLTYVRSRGSKKKAHMMW